MKRYTVTLILATIFAIPTSAFAQLQELFISITPSEESAVRTKNDYFLKKHLYFAKRHRIVRVNTDLFETAVQFSIPLFDDESISVSRTKVEANSDRYIINWHGQIADPPFPAEELTKQGVPLEESEFLHSTLFSISMAAVSHDYDLATGASTPSSFRKTEDNAGLHTSTFYAVAADISVPTLPSQYKLISLEMDRRYHLLIEIDPAKMFPPGPYFDAEHPELGTKRQQYADFIYLLGQDPRRTAIPKDNSQ